MNERFNKLIPIILHNEGGLVDDPDDKGGLTKYGISQRAYPSIDIRNLTVEYASTLYYNDYYLPLRLELIQLDELALHIFDMAVNAGKKTAVILLQQVLKLIHTDGILGPITANLANHYGPEVIDKYKEARIEYYTRISANGNNSKFLLGWIYRVEHTKLS